MDGVAPYTYSEELPYDDLLDQHASGRLMLTAATFSAPLPGSRNNSIYFKGVGDTLNQNTF